MIRKMGYAWHLRQLMAAKDMFQTSDLQPLLAALCDILDCTPNDLIEVRLVDRSVRKTTAGTADRRSRRSVIRRPPGS